MPVIRILWFVALVSILLGMYSCGGSEAAGAGGFAGTGGTGGAAGSGGTAGAGGSGGEGGAADCCLTGCEPVLDAVPPNFAAEPPSDSSELISGPDENLCEIDGELVGACPSGGCVGDDPVDRWSIIPSVDGRFRLSLDWEMLADLDLYVFDSDGRLLGQSATEGTAPETILADLETGQTYTIQSQAFETGGAQSHYTLTVTRSE